MVQCFCGQRHADREISETKATGLVTLFCQCLDRMLHRSIQTYAGAELSSLRAHAAHILNSQVGLEGVSREVLAVGPVRKDERQQRPFVHYSDVDLLSDAQRIFELNT